MTVPQKDRSKNCISLLSNTPYQFFLKFWWTDFIYRSVGFQLIDLSKVVIIKKNWSLSAFQNWFKLVQGPFGQSNMISATDQPGMNVPKQKICYDTIHWFAGLLEQMTGPPSAWCSKHYSFYNFRALKTLFFLQNYR